MRTSGSQERESIRARMAENRASVATQRGDRSARRSEADCTPRKQIACRCGTHKLARAGARITGTRDQQRRLPRSNLGCSLVLSV